MSEKKSILLIEDEKGLIMTIKDRLEEEGYLVDSAEDGEAGFRKASKNTYNLIILDLMLPKKGGLDVCRDLRQQKIETPIIMLTAKGQVLDKVLGLKLGADDYMQKPFEMMELLARIEVQFRKTNRSEKAQSLMDFSFGDIHINFERMHVQRNGEDVVLSAKEFQLLRFLAINEGEILSRDQLLNEVWGYDALPSTRTVDVHIAWLRQKLEKDSRYPRHILTVHGFGYKLVV
ncbi:MAG: response regulator transcription factor [Balneolales bacterium]|nr:response regulator transcription factor [Balneolales bacterium]